MNVESGYSHDLILVKLDGALTVAHLHCAVATVTDICQECGKSFDYDMTDRKCPNCQEVLPSLTTLQLAYEEEDVQEPQEIVKRGTLIRSKDGTVLGIVLDPVDIGSKVTALRIP